MRKRALETVFQLAKSYENVVYVGSDVGKGTLSQFHTAFPERFFVEAISEGYVIGMAAGLAMNGLIPYVNTIGTFLTRRCLDQIAVDLCIGNHPVRLVANGGGLVYAPLGPTHEAIEDIALMRCLPNMTVVAPCDAEEMQRVVHASYDWPGPMYIRIARGGEQVVSKSEDFALGKAVGYGQGTQVLLATTGVMLQTGLEVQEMLNRHGCSCGVVHFHTIKPLDTTWLAEHAQRYTFCASLEEHSVIGGLGSALAEWLCEQKQHPRLKRFGIPDRFCDRFGNQAALLQYFGLDAETIFQELIGWAFNK